MSCLSTRYGRLLDCSFHALVMRDVQVCGRGGGVGWSGRQAYLGDPWLLPATGEEAVAPVVRLARGGSGAAQACMVILYLFSFLPRQTDGEGC